MNDTARTAAQDAVERRLGQRCDRRAPARARDSVHRAHAGRELSRPARQPRQPSRQHAAGAAALRARGDARSRSRTAMRASPGKPLAVALHANVGLMHATMAIFNAWCDRIPMLLLGGVGPIDAMKRRPWVDWIHTSRDLGALVRGYTKWDDQPGSVPAALEAILRAYRIAMTLPQGPDVRGARRGAAGRSAGGARAAARRSIASAPATAGTPPEETVREVARAARRRAASAAHDRPRVERSRATSTRRVALAERIGAVVLTDIKTGASVSDAASAAAVPAEPVRDRRRGAADRDADVILSLDWIDLGGTLRQACGGELPRGKVIQCSLDQYVHNGYNMDYQALPPTDLSVLAAPDALVAALRRRARRRAPRRRRRRGSRRPRKPRRRRRSADGRRRAADRMPLADLARVTMETLAPHRPSYIRLPLGWPGEPCRLRASARLHRLRRRRRHRLGSGHGDRRGARAARRRSAAGRGARRRRLPDGRDRAVDRRPLSQSRC